MTPVESESFGSIAKQLTDIADQVRATEEWYKRNARPRMLLFRAAGVLVILLSVSVPFIAAQQAGWKDTALSIAALAIALLTGLNAFFRWETAWQSYRQAQYALEHLRSVWELRMIEARHQPDSRKAIEMAIRATEQLLADARATTSAETSEYFRHVQMPQSRGGG